jgi:hypothetical protein
VLFGSESEELAKNVIRIEASFRFYEMFKILQVNCKPRRGWKITDFNNVLNENPIVKN